MSNVKTEKYTVKTEKNKSIISRERLAAMCGGGSFLKVQRNRAKNWEGGG